MVTDFFILCASAALVGVALSCISYVSACASFKRTQVVALEKSLKMAENEVGRNEAS